MKRNVVRDQVVLRRYAAGESQTAIAQSFGISRQAINKIVAHYGLTRRRGKV